MIKVSDLPNEIEEWKLYLKEDGLSNNSIRTYTTALFQLFKFLNKKGYEELTKSSLIAYKEELDNQRKNGVIKVTTLNTKILGIDRFLLDMNTELGNFRLKTERVQQRFMLEDRLTSDDLTKLVKRALERKDFRDAMIMKTLAKTGIRVGELSYFTVESIQKALDCQCISIINKKKERIIVVPKKLCHELLNYAENNRIESGMIFPNRKGTGVTDPGHMARRFRKIALECNVNPKYCNPQNFRKLFATTYLQQTNDLIGLSDLLGHSNLATTRIYLHKTIKENNQAITELFLDI